MITKPSLFRREAIDRLTSPDQLDRLIHITTPQSWLMMLAFGSVIIIFLLWSIFGELVTTVEQSGLLSLNNTIEMIIAPQSGRIEEILITPGEQVEAGQVLATMQTSSKNGETQLENILSPNDGRIISVRVDVGTPVTDGTPLFSLEDFSNSPDELMAFTFLTVGEVQSVKTGMTVKLRPISSNQLEGYLLGTVASVSTYPATEAELAMILGNESSMMTNDRTLLFETRINLNQDSQGYQWTVAADAGFDLISGMAVQVIIETSKERPISRILKAS